MKRSLMESVSVREMQEMRDNEGMSNNEIAEALDVFYMTVYKYIGAQPKGLRKARKVLQDRQPIKEEPAPACLVLQNRNIELHGVVGVYGIDCKAQSVHITYNGHDMWILFDKLGTFIDELKAIHRKIDFLAVTKDMW